MDCKKILIIAATDLSDDNSASLCHSAYIRGFVEAGHIVQVITVKPVCKNYLHEVLGAEYIYISDENWLVRKVRERRNARIAQIQSTGINDVSKNIVKLNIKELLLQYLGATVTWMRRVKKLKLDTLFDLTISLSSPATSHEVANSLIKQGSIKTKEWCQLWEDPWSTDLYKVDSSVYEKEKKLLDQASKILYVTPLTLAQQKKLFPEDASKMDWLPLPTYFSENNSEFKEGTFTFGYFGQYFTQVRNLKPVYDAINELHQEFIICGEPHDLFRQTETIHIYPRMSPDKLVEYENKTNVLIFVANLGGGQIPGKIYQYSGTNKWILFILDGTAEEKAVLKEYFEKYERYVFCENTVDSIKNAINKILMGKVDTVKNSPVNYFEAKSIVNEILNKMDI